MRIEIFASGGSILALQQGLDSLHSDIGSTIESLRRTDRKLNNITNGLGNLSGASNNIQTRIRMEETRQAAVEQLSRRTSTFLSNVVCIDTQVSNLVVQNQEKFFRSHEWLRPTAATGTSWWEQRVQDWNNFWSAAGDALRSAWDGVVNFVKEHAVELIIGAVATVVGAALIAFTGGTAAAFIPALLAGLKAATTAALVSGAISSVIALFTGEDILKAFGDGLASGFMFGGIGYMFKGIFAFIKFVRTPRLPQTPKTYTQADLANVDFPDYQKNGVDHVFNGEIKANGKPGGYHYNMVDESAGKIIEGTRTAPNKYGVYEAKVSINGKIKSTPSSFFPDHMSPKQISNCIDDIVQNTRPRILNNGMSSYTGFSNKIKIQVYLDASGNLTSAYPIYKDAFGDGLRRALSSFRIFK